MESDNTIRIISEDTQRSVDKHCERTEDEGSEVEGKEDGEGESKINPVECVKTSSVLEEDFIQYLRDEVETHLNPPALEGSTSISIMWRFRANSINAVLDAINLLDVFNVGDKRRYSTTNTFFKSLEAELLDRHGPIGLGNVIDGLVTLLFFFYNIKRNRERNPPGSRIPMIVGEPELKISRDAKRRVKNRELFNSTKRIIDKFGRVECEKELDDKIGEMIH